MRRQRALCSLITLVLKRIYSEVSKAFVLLEEQLGDILDLSTFSLSKSNL